MMKRTSAMTRRDVGLAFMAASGVVAVAQQPPSEDLLAAARARVKTNSETLRSFKLPIATEPSFVFRP